MNDGPWGAALTTEFIPQPERKYRIDATYGQFPRRPLQQHRATLQLQVSYSKILAGRGPRHRMQVTSTSFSEIDLYAPNANVYRKPDGSRWPMIAWMAR